MRHKSTPSRRLSSVFTCASCGSCTQACDLLLWLLHGQFGSAFTCPTAYCIDRMSAARQGWLQAALGAAAGAAAAALLIRRRQRSNLQASEELDSADDPLRRFRKTEAVIRRRNSRVVVVIERCNESHNCAARCHFKCVFTPSTRDCSVPTQTAPSCAPPRPSATTTSGSSRRLH